MEQRIKSYIDVVLENQKVILVMLALITVFLAWQASLLKIDNELDIWFNRESEDFRNYQDFVSNFGDDRNLYVIYQSAKLFSQPELDKNRQLTERLGKVAGVKTVNSLMNLKIPRVGAVGVGERPVVPDKPQDFERLQKRLCSQEIFVNSILSRDGRATVIQLITENSKVNPVVYEDVRKVLAQLPEGPYYLAGGIAIFEETAKLSSTEPALFLTIANTMLFVLLLVVFRKFVTAIVPLGFAYTAIIWTMGLMQLIGGSVNMITGIVPLIILIISIAFSIHFLGAFRKLTKEGFNVKEAIERSYYQVLRPGTVTALTTAVAFSAFTLTSVMPIRYFGIATAFGVIAMYLLTVLLMPVILNRFAHRLSASGIDDTKSFERVPEKLVRVVDRQKTLVVLLSVILVTVSFYGISKVHFESDQIKYFGSSNPVRLATDKADEWFEGIYPFELIIDVSGVPNDSMQALFTKLKQLQNELKAVEGVATVHSAETIAEAVRNLNPIKVAEWKIFRELVINEKTSDEGLGRMYVNAKEHKLRVTIKSKWKNNQAALLTESQIKKCAQTTFADWSLPFYVTGTAILLAGLNDDLLAVQIKSVGLSFLVIFIFLIIIFRQPRYFILGMLPNILPVMVSTGLIGLLGIPMDVGTVLIASITLGIAVDDTIYFLNAYRNEEVLHGDKQAILKTYEKVWKPIVLTSVLLSSGFVLLVFSDYSPVKYLGLILAVNMMVALSGDIFLLPSLLRMRTHENPVH